jgi:hypothetical protein
MVQTARRNAHDAKSMFDELSSALAKMQRSDADRQFMALLGRGLMQVVKYPGKLIELVMTGFGKGYGEALASKYS